MAKSIALCLGTLFLGLVIIFFSPALEGQTSRRGLNSRRPVPSSRWDDYQAKVAPCMRNYKGNVSEINSCLAKVLQREDARLDEAYDSALRGRGPIEIYRIKHIKIAWGNHRHFFSDLLYPTASLEWLIKEVNNHSKDIESLRDYMIP
ncbi:MAG: hypothetical protein LBJ61_05515 [Deltaproteobacteria bacterium]|jgi:uncharacterized protein YecT (DUF1311 family)|nr:hypothetical protein [Deltaproteobacteria bacterium]